MKAKEEKIVLDREFEVTSNSPDDFRSSKKWGYVSALPSEYLVHFRNGKIRERSSGQGATCFKFLRDTVFIIPTSLKEIVFQANQLTADNVDVRIRGMAVYRIHDPFQIYRLINFSHRERAEEKLARMIADMCRSTAKWLVANMKLEECIRKRKEEIAAALKNEVSQVVGDKAKGWGVEITTIDIQDVYIQDAEIFEAMQMMFKSDKMRESRMAGLETDRQVQMKQMEMERYLAEQRMQNQLQEAKIEAEVKDTRILLARQNEEKQFALDRYRVEQNEELSNYKFEQDMDRDRKKMLLHLENTRKEIEAKTIADEEGLEMLRHRIEIENSTNPASLERHFVEHALPQIAKAMAESMKETTMNIYQQDGQAATPFNFLLVQLMNAFRMRTEVARKAGQGGE